MGTKRIFDLRSGIDGTNEWNSCDIIIAIVGRETHGMTLASMMTRMDIIRLLQVARDTKAKSISLTQSQWELIEDAYKRNQFPEARQFLLDIWLDIFNSRAVREDDDAESTSKPN